MTIAHSNTSTAIDAGANSTTISSFVVSGTDPVLVVKVALKDNSATVTGVTFNTSETFDPVGSDRNGNAHSSMWVLEAPTATTADVVISLSGSTRHVSAVSLYTGVDQATPIRAASTTTANGTNAAPTVDITSETGEMVIDSLSQVSAGPDTAAGDNTERHDTAATGGGTDTRGASQELAGTGGTDTMGWTMGGSDNWAIVGAALQEPQPITLVIAETNHGHTADNLAMNTDLTIADATHAHSADNLTISLEFLLEIQETSHVHTADNLDIEVDLNIAEALHAHTADNLDITQNHIITPNDTNHAHTADNISIGIDLSINDALHAHTADNLTIELGETTLVIAEALHTQTADNLIIEVEGITLVVQSANHAHSADNLDLKIDLAIDDSLLLHIVDNLSIGIELIIGDADHAHSADNLEIELVLDIADAEHAQTADNITFTQNHIFSIQSNILLHTADNLKIIPEPNIIQIEGIFLSSQVTGLIESTKMDGLLKSTSMNGNIKAIGMAGTLKAPKIIGNIK